MTEGAEAYDCWFQTKVSTRQSVNYPIGRGRELGRAAAGPPAHAATFSAGFLSCEGGVVTQLATGVEGGGAPGHRRIVPTHKTTNVGPWFWSYAETHE
jgi:hypothetical protein